MSIFSVFEVFTVFCIFPHKGKCFEHGKGDIRDQQHKKNQNMYKKLKKEMCSNFALFAPYNQRERTPLEMEIGMGWTIPM